MKTKNIIYPLFLLFTVLCSCNKDEDGQKSKVCYLTKLSAEGQIINGISYLNNLPTTLSGYDSLGLPTSSVDFEFDLKGQLSKLSNRGKDGSLGSYQTIQYNIDGLAAKILSYSKNSGGEFEVTGFTTIQYNENKKPIKTAYFSGSEASPEQKSYEAYEYNIDGNVAKSSSYTQEFSGSTSFILSTTSEYEYDKMKSYLQSLKLPPVIVSYMSNNNITKTTVKGPTGTIKPKDSYNVTYEYNVEGYPVKSIQTNLDSGKPSVLNFEYNCN